MNEIKSQPAKCPRCGGASLAGDAPEGLCPRCLGALNLATETVVTGDKPAPLPPLDPAELAAHFPQLEILECLGRGGMGVVYKARQKSLDRLVALKLLAPEREQDPRFAERFAREAKALASLNHPGIVTIHDFGQAGGFYFLLMEFVDGLNLRQLLRARKLSPAEALAIVPQLCDALQFAHDRGIVHRDIKPENLLLAKDGRVKIADFGIAKMLGLRTPDTGITETQPAGTPGYMAPEQKAGPGEADSRADIYSLGVVFYEMLTGEMPADRIQPPSHKVLIDVRLDEIVMRALAKTPDLRWQTAADVRTQVETMLASLGTSSIPGNAGRLGAALGHLAGTRRGLPGWRVLLACGTVIMMALGVFNLARRVPSPPLASSESKANLPLFPSPDDSPAFGPVWERVLGDLDGPLSEAPGDGAPTNLPPLIDFETGKLFTPPEQLKRANITKQKEWMVSEGVDALASLAQFNGLAGVDLVARQVTDGDWDSAVPSTLATLLDAMPQEEVMILSVHEPLPCTWAFRTREGSVGMLQTVRLSSDLPRQLTLRYKLAKGGSATANSQPPVVEARPFTPSGEPPNPTAIYQEAKELAGRGQYEAALQRHLWYHANAVKYEPSLSAVRRSFVLMDWIELGRKYPPARQALIEISARDTRKFGDGQGHFDLFMDVAAINRELGNETATVALFKLVHERDQALARQCYFAAEDLLVRRHEYELCDPYVTDWEGILDTWRRTQEMDAKIGTGRAGRERAEWIQSSNRRLTGKIANLVEILLANGHRDDALEVQRRALALLDEPKIRSAVGDAEKRIASKGQVAF